MSQYNPEYKERIRTHIRPPQKYSVVLHNDDFTPMDFVTMILMEIYSKSHTEALALMLKVHNTGKAVVGDYPLDIANTLCEITIESAREEGYPLKVTVEKVDLPF